MKSRVPRIIFIPLFLVVSGSLLFYLFMRSPKNSSNLLPGNGSHIGSFQAIDSARNDSTIEKDDKTAASTATELSYHAVVDTWRHQATDLGLSEAAINAESERLRRILSGPHRRIDEHNVLEFSASLKNFAPNARTTFDPKDRNPRGFALLEFCCDAAWLNQLDESQQNSVVQDYQHLTSQTLDWIKSSIEDSIPKEKEDLWKPRVEYVVNALNSQINKDIKSLNSDFLFPAFKTPLDESLRRETLGMGDAFGLIPSYGPSHAPTQTNDDKFAHQLKDFASFFESAYLARLAFSEVSTFAASRDDWKQFNYGADGGSISTGWPVSIVIDSPASRESAKGR